MAVINKKTLKNIVSLLFCVAIVVCGSKTAFSAQSVGFSFSRNSLVFQKDKNNKPVAQLPMIVPTGVTKPEKVSGYTVKYSRTHKGDGERIKVPEKAITAPSQAGTYTATITFSDDSGYNFSPNVLEKSYPAALTIRRAEQAMPILRSASATLVEAAGVQGGTIKAGELGIISTSWSSGIKPIYTWSIGSEAVVTPETGKVARFIAKAEGTAVLNVTIPQDNNYAASQVARYVVNVGSSAVSPNGLYYIEGEKSANGWYISDVSIIAKNGYTKVLPDTSNPITNDGVTVINFSLATDTGDTTELFTQTIKKDSSAPVIDNVTINDSPFLDAPDDDINAWAGATNIVIKADVFDTASGIARLEYRVDGQDYISVADKAFSDEGTKNYEFTHTLEGAGHTLFLKATDHAGNVSVQDFSISEEKTTPLPPEAPVEAPVDTLKEIITQPTQGMQDVLARLTYLNRNNIEAKVIGDVRANKDYVQVTLDMFTALRSAEKEALGEEKLTALRDFFEMLYKVIGKDVNELQALFVFEAPPVLPPVSQSVASKSESVSQSVSAPQSESVSQGMSKPNTSSMPLPPKTQAPPFSLLYLIPIIVCIGGFAAYFIWQKRLKSNKAKFTLNADFKQNTQATQEDFTFGGFDDMDE